MFVGLRLCQGLNALLKGLKWLTAPGGVGEKGFFWVWTCQLDLAVTAVSRSLSGSLTPGFIWSLENMPQKRRQKAGWQHESQKPKHVWHLGTSSSL